MSFPLVLDYYEPVVSRYLTLPPSFERWTAFVTFGALFGVASFLQTVYVKGEFRWLLGKFGGGIVSLAFYSYVFIFLPGTSSAQISQVGGLLILVYAAVGLSYVHMILDFMEARRARIIGRL